MSNAKIATLIVGILMALVGLGLGAGGAGLLWINETQSDPDGFFTSDVVVMSTDGHALTSAQVDLGSRPGDWFPSGRLATVRLEIEGQDDTTIFVGIGPADDVDGYLDDVAHSEMTRIIDGDVVYRNVAGDTTPSRPGDQDFWVASEQGNGVQTLAWDLEQGRWAVVVMNSDSSPGVTVAAAAAARTDLLVWIAIGLAVFGLILLAVATVLIVAAVRRTPEGAPAVPPGQFGPYPVRLEGRLDSDLSRWQWLFKWLLALPHFMILAFLWIAFVLLTIVAWFAILFTGRYPRSLFDFNVGVLRWSWRVGYYSYGALGTDRYPPFTLAETDYPASFDVAYPEKLSRGLVLVKWWLLAIPHYLIVGLFTSGLIWWTTEIGDGNQVAEAGAGLIGILVFIAGLILLFTGRYPQGLFDLVVGLNRWVFRVAAYATLMRDEYPPFRLDTGSAEPGAIPSPPVDEGDDPASTPTLDQA